MQISNPISTQIPNQVFFSTRSPWKWTNMRLISVGKYNFIKS